MWQQLLLKYAVAIVAVIAALELRLLLNPFLGVTVPFITFFLAVMVAAWYGGFGPGVLAALASTVVADHFFIAPIGTFSFNSANVVALSLFVTEAIGISILSEGLHRAKQEAEAGALKMEHLLNSISDAFVAVGTDWRYTVVNRRAAEILGRPEEDLLGGSLWELFPENPGTDVWAHLHEAMAGKTPRRFEYFHESSQRWFENRLYPHAGGLSVFFSDITERKQSEQRLTQWNIELEQRVLERTQTLTASQARLRALAAQLSLTEQRERRRLAIELHDYLAQMLALAQIKLAQVRRRIPLPAAQDHLAQELEEILAESLNYTRTMVTELSPPVLHQFGLVMGVRWLAEQMLRHGLTVDVQAKQEIPALAEDRLIFTFQSIRELLLNVVKHAGVNDVVAKISMNEDQELQVTVLDHGRGFDPDTITGSDQFGLYSIRERMEAVGGRLDLLSASGRGTSVTLTVPAGQVATEAMSRRVSPEREGCEPDIREDREASVPRATRLLRVLLVDDHALVRQGLDSILKGYQDLRVVGEAANGQEALEGTRRLHPDVVLMDVNMPVMNGVEATRLIKREFPATAVIGLSVNMNMHVEKAMRDAGAAAYLTKEMALEELHSLLHAVTQATPEGIGSRPLS